MKDDSEIKHDPLQQDGEENILEAEAVERETDTDEVRPEEEAAMNTDNDTAREATIATEETELDEVLEEEAVVLEEEATPTKHKNRESTSEKAKRSTRQSTSEKAKEAEEARIKQLDPLRLRGKKYRAKASLISHDQSYTIAEAVQLVKDTSTTNFDAAVELHCKLKSEGVRGTVTLPHGNGKSRKVAVATDDVIEEIANGKMDFDVLLATPAMMPKLAKYAKVLGPKGLMPSPKAGTVTEDIEKVMAEISGGRVEYRSDKSSVVHMSIGRVSFTNEQLIENFETISAILQSSKMLTCSLASTMGPGVKVNLV